MPKSYLTFKWAVYALATLLLFSLQSIILNHIHILGVTPFIYPMLPAVAAMYEGKKRGPLFALALGLVCDLLLYGPYEGFFTVTFVILAMLSSVVAENMLSTGFFSGVMIAALSLLLTGAMRVGLQILTGGPHIRLMAWIAAVEALISIPAAVIVVPLYRTIHNRCAADY